MELLSIAMKTSHHHGVGSSNAANYLDVPLSPPLSSPSPTSVQPMISHHDDDFRPSSAGHRSISDSDRPLKKRRKQERPSLFIDRRTTSDDVIDESKSVKRDRIDDDEDADEEDDDQNGSRGYDFVWNELASTSSPEVQSPRDGSDKENNVASSHVSAGRDDEDDDGEAYQRDVTGLSDNSTAAGSPSSQLPLHMGGSSGTGGLSTAGSMLLRQLVFQNPLLAAAAGRSLDSLPPMTVTPPSPSQYGGNSNVRSTPPPLPISAVSVQPVGDPFSGTAASDDGEGGADDGDGGPETCPECQKVFKRRVYLQRHMAREHWSTARIFKCDKCSYETKHQSNLLVHRRTHTGERPYHCGACGQRYTQGHLLKAHIRSRHGSEMAFYNMDKRSDGVRCRRALNAIRTAAATQASSGSGTSPHIHHSGSGVKEDKIRFLLEAAEATRNQQHHQQQQLSGVVSGSMAQHGQMAASISPFSAMSLGQYVSALSTCLPQQHQHRQAVPLSSGAAVAGTTSGLVRGPLIWTPSTNMSLAAAAGFIGGTAFQTQQKFQNQQRSSACTSDSGLALTTHAALMSSLAATPYQPIVGSAANSTSINKQPHSLNTSSMSVLRTGIPSDSTSLLSSLLQAAPYGSPTSGMRFAMSPAVSTAATEQRSSPSHQQQRAALRDSGRQSPEDLSKSTGKRRIDEDEAEKKAEAELSSTTTTTRAMMLSFLSSHLGGRMSPFVAAAAAAAVNASTATIDCEKKLSPDIDVALDLAMPSTVASGKKDSSHAIEKDGREPRMNHNEEEEEAEGATDLSARTGAKHKRRSAKSAKQSNRLFLSEPSSVAKSDSDDSAVSRSTELDLSRPRKHRPEPTKFTDDTDDVYRIGGGPLAHDDLVFSDKKTGVSPQPSPRTKSKDTTSCCVGVCANSTSPTNGVATCPHLTKLRQLRRNVYRMLSVFTPYLDVAGFGGVADVEADSVDDFLHEVIYSSKLGAASSPKSY